MVGVSGYMDDRIAELPSFEMSGEECPGEVGLESKL
jgi:hypothetical protein